MRLYLVQLLKALYYCHRVIKVIHRDIKPENIVINDNDEAVLIDFGVSALVEDQEDDTLKNVMGTQMYYAPEMIKEAKRGDKLIRGELTDIWAVGITVFQLLTGSLPYKNVTNLLELREAVLNLDFDFSKIKDNSILHCLRQILQKDPSKRASLE